MIVLSIPVVLTAVLVAIGQGNASCAEEGVVKVQGRQAGNKYLRTGPAISISNGAGHV